MYVTRLTVSLFHFNFFILLNPKNIRKRIYTQNISIKNYFFIVYQHIQFENMRNACFYSVSSIFWIFMLICLFWIWVWFAKSLPVCLSLIMHPLHTIWWIKLCLRKDYIHTVKIIFNLVIVHISSSYGQILKIKLNKLRWST